MWTNLDRENLALRRHWWSQGILRSPKSIARTYVPGPGSVAQLRWTGAPHQRGIRWSLVWTPQGSFQCWTNRLLLGKSPHPPPTNKIGTRQATLCWIVARHPVWKNLTRDLRFKRMGVQHYTPNFTRKDFHKTSRTKTSLFSTRTEGRSCTAPIIQKLFCSPLKKKSSQGFS